VEGAGDGGGPVDPAPRPKRRSFTAQYKLAIVEEYEQTPNGQKGALLRREGLYSSHVIEWTRARDEGVLRAGSRAGTGAGQGEPARARKRRSAAERENEELRRKYAKLEAEHAKTQMALDIVGKAFALLETISERADTEKSPKKP
jgi:transposase-like protein